MNMLYKGKVVLMRGEASKLAMDMIASFLEDGAIVIFPAKSFRQIEMIKSYGDINELENFITLLIDPNDFDAVTETCETITGKFGNIDIAIDIPEFSSVQKHLTDVSLEEWNQMIETDMLPFFLGARVVLNLMKGSRNGMFVHVTDGRWLSDLKSCALARIAFTTRAELSNIFAEEAKQYGVRYYHIRVHPEESKEASACKEASPWIHTEQIRDTIKNLYQNETYDIASALQPFPISFIHPER